MKDYRDKCIAHWEETLPNLTIPSLDLASDSAGYLMDWLRDNDENDANWPVTQDAKDPFDKFKDEGVGSFGA